MRELREEDPEAFINYMRMPMELYDEVLSRITPCVTKQDYWWRQAIDPGLKFACTMRHLASGIQRQLQQHKVELQGSQ